MKKRFIRLFGKRKYKIIPHGTSKFIVTTNSWFFGKGEFILNNKGRWSSSNHICGTEIFPSVETAIENLKLTIIRHGIKMAHNLQDKIDIKKHKLSQKAIIVPPFPTKKDN